MIVTYAEAFAIAARGLTGYFVVLFVLNEIAGFVFRYFVFFRRPGFGQQDCRSNACI